jgi:PBSX family phage terminase large subunit
VSTAVKASDIAARLFANLRNDADVSIELYQQQQAFVGTDSPYAAFVAGIGSGKTYAGCTRALRAGLGHIGDVSITTPNLGIITAPTYPMLRDVTARTFLDIADAHIDAYNRGDMTIRLRNGSEILMRTAEHPDRLRGFNASWWYGDEAALYRPDVWRIMVGRLRQFGQRGYAWLTTTPRGRDWIYKLFGTGQDGYEIIRAASRDNIYLDDAIIEAWQGEYSGDFARQELLGEFIAHQGLVYEEFSQDHHVVSDGPQGFRDVICGVDWGYANPGVMIVAGMDGDGRLWILTERYQRQQRIEEWASVAVDLRDTYGVSQFVCDPSEPDYIRTLQQAGVKAAPANNTVMTGIQAVKHRLATVTPTAWGDLPRLVIGRSCVNLISEFEQYQWRENRDGMQDQPVKANDHAMDALRYLVMAVDAPRRQKLTARTIRYA